MALKRYVYNTQTFQYETVQIQLKTVLRNLGYCTVAAAVLAGVLVVLNYTLFTDVEELYYQRQNQELLALLTDFDSSIAKTEQQLVKVHKNDVFFRSLLNEEPIDQARWEAGIGGDDKPADGIPPKVHEINRRMAQLKYKYELQDESFGMLTELAKKKDVELNHIPAIRPVLGRIVSGFGNRRDPFKGHFHFHAGLDFHAPIGTKVVSVGDGVVRTAGNAERGYGIQVEVDHGFGYITKYAHLSRCKVKVGDVVKRGDIVGHTGNTGYSTGPHLHYEVIKNGRKVNPYDYFYSN